MSPARRGHRPDRRARGRRADPVLDHPVHEVRTMTPTDARRRGHRRRRGDGLLGGLPPPRRPGLSGRRRDREGPDLPAIPLGALRRLDPAAILEPREHPHLAFWNRLPARGSATTWRSATRCPRSAFTKAAISTARRRPGPRSCAENHALQIREGPTSSSSTRTELEAPLPPGSPPRTSPRHLGAVRRGLVRRLGALPQAFRRKARSLGAEYGPERSSPGARGRPRVAAVRLADGTSIRCGARRQLRRGGRAGACRDGRVDIPVDGEAPLCLHLHVPGAHRELPLLIDVSGRLRPPRGPRLHLRRLAARADDPAWDDPDPATQEVDHGFFEDVVRPRSPGGFRPSRRSAPVPPGPGPTTCASSTATRSSDRRRRQLLPLQRLLRPRPAARPPSGASPNSSSTGASRPSTSAISATSVLANRPLLGAECHLKRPPDSRGAVVRWHRTTRWDGRSPAAGREHRQNRLTGCKAPFEPAMLVMEPSHDCHPAFVRG